MKLEAYPKISIVTPVYNNIKYIEDCITSVLNQEYSNLEYIVIDGGSTDGTAQIIEKYADQLAYYVSEKDRGQTHALNKGFAKASGDVLAWLNADEEYLPGTLMEVGKAFMANSELDFFFGNRVIIDENHDEIGRKRWVPMHPQWHLLYRMSVLPTDASFWSAKVHRLTGSLDEESFPRLSMDYDWLLRLSFFVKKWKRTSDYLSKYTERADRITNLGAILDPVAGRNNSCFARSRIIEKHRYSKVKLFFGWFIAGTWCRIYEKRINVPHILISLRDLFMKQ